VLLGCKRVLNQFKPHGILALHPNGIKSNGNTLNDIYDLVEAYDYDMVYEKAIISKENFCSQTDLFDVHISPRQEKLSTANP
jgi:hypothetical protein